MALAKGMKESKYRPEYCEMLIAHMSKGFSYDTFAADVHCGRQTLYDWEKVHPDWKEAKQEAIECAQKFFESRLIAKIAGQEIKGLKVRDIDTSCLIFALKTRFHKTYGETQKIEQTVKTIEEYVRENKEN